MYKQDDAKMTQLRDKGEGEKFIYKKSDRIKEGDKEAV